jgi:branched-chain amino acid aminotransferase
MKIFLDGEYLDREQAKISVFDHGLLYGDGVFEGIRAYNGRIFKLEEHVARLFDSARAILLKIPMTAEQLCEACVRCCALNNVRDGYIRLVVTRGVGSLGLNPESCPRPTVFIIADAIQLYSPEVYEKGMRLVTASTRRVAPAAFSPAIKSLNYLNNILAKIEGQLAGAQEVLMLNEQGYVAECSGDNIFVIKHNTIYTPPIHAGALGGITRRVAMDLLSQAGHSVVEMQLTRYDIYVADECFLTGTGAEIVPVIELDGRMIGDGVPGRITKAVIADYRKLTATTGTRIF